MLKLALVGFAGLFTVTLSTRSITKDSYINGLITSILAGSFYWLTLQVAIPKLDSIFAGIVYVIASTFGRMTGMWFCMSVLERYKIESASYYWNCILLTLKRKST